MTESVRRVLDVFEQINQVPRKSKHEERISQWLLDWAKEHGFQAKMDKVRNVLIEVPASSGMEKAPVVVLQGHMDMVCEKTPESTHDFSRDGIQSYMDGQWMKARGTTLGADNGIALAMALVAATDDALKRPAMELLFTVDEETGLTGANALEPGFLQGKVLLNLDSEDEGVFTVGCAGGRDTHLTLDVDREPVDAQLSLFKVSVGGLQGGHSGVDIAEHRANANIILAHILEELLNGMGARLVDLDGGSAHNAIPRNAHAVLGWPQSRASELSEVVKHFEASVKASYASPEKGFYMKVESVDSAEHAEMLTLASAGRVVDLMIAMPHGIAGMSPDIKDLVETSNNFARIQLTDKGFQILSSQRSSDMTKLDWITRKIEKVGILAGATAETGNGYPAWQPNMESPLLARCQQVYEKLFGKKPVVEAIHAGLECGIIGAKYDGMDMISFGPTIKNPHSPDEMLHVPSVDMVWDFLAALLASYGE